MNKTVPILLASLITSILLVWYLATKSTHSQTWTTQNQNVLIVGTNAEYAPFSFMENNNITGFDVDLINEVATGLGKTIEIKDMPFDALVPALQTGTIHLIAAGITPTPERAQKALFTKPYLVGDPLVIVSNATNPLTSLKQLTGKTVAVNEGYTADYYMSSIIGPQLIHFAAPLESFMALDSGRVDALVATQNTVAPFLEHYGSAKFVATPIPNTNDEYALAISKRFPELLEPIQNALDTIKRDGTLESLKKKWKLH